MSEEASDLWAGHKNLFYCPIKWLKSSLTMSSTFPDFRCLVLLGCDKNLWSAGLGYKKEVLMMGARDKKRPHFPLLVVVTYVDDSTIRILANQNRNIP